MTLLFSLTTKCSPCWMLALKGTGNNSSTFSVNPPPEIQSCFPWPTGDKNDSEPGVRGTKQTKLWRTETWLDVTYLLSNRSGQSWGRTGGVHFGKQHKPPFPLKNSCTASVPVLLHTPSPFPSWNINMAFWIRVEKQNKKTPYFSSGLSIESSSKSVTVYDKPLVLML